MDYFKGFRLQLLFTKRGSIRKFHKRREVISRRSPFCPRFRKHMDLSYVYYCIRNHRYRAAVAASAGSSEPDCEVIYIFPEYWRSKINV